MIIGMSKKSIDSVFEVANNSNEYLEKMYRMAIPDWDKVISAGFDCVKVNKTTGEYIMAKALAFDKIIGSPYMPGGPWLNQGFSVLDNEAIGDWEVKINLDDIEYSDKEDR